MTAQNSSEVRCPVCPICGWPPPFIAPTFAQAFCPNPDCKVYLWDPWVPAAANLADQREVELRPAELQADVDVDQDRHDA